MSEYSEKFSISSFAPYFDAMEFQKSYLFMIFLPSIGDSIPPPSDYEYCVSNVSFPQVNISTQPIIYFNSEIKIANKITYSDWSATFKYNLFDSSGTDANKIYNYFNMWMSLINDPIRRTSSLPYFYKSSINLFLLNENFDTTAKFLLMGAFPISISANTLGFNEDSIFQFTVNFSFDAFQYYDETKG